MIEFKILLRFNILMIKKVNFKLVSNFQWTFHTYRNFLWQDSKRVFMDLDLTFDIIFKLDFTFSTEQLMSNFAENIENFTCTSKNCWGEMSSCLSVKILRKSGKYSSLKSESLNTFSNFNVKQISVDTEGSFELEHKFEFYLFDQQFLKTK